MKWLMLTMIRGYQRLTHSWMPPICRFHPSCSRYTAEAIQLYATRLLGRSGDGWTMTGIDPEGIDLRRGGEVARLGFDGPVSDPEAARAALVQLVARARAKG